mmetsp:Transcript_5397/g.17073  ORF Transcript_5397/g.17073 Transcript_5397/m.17073 type:complete len:200 (-) Transcript_5397:297-896(-)
MSVSTVYKYRFSLARWTLCFLRAPPNVPRQCASVSHTPTNFRQTRSSRPVRHLIQLQLKLCLRFSVRNTLTPTPLELRSASTVLTRRLLPFEHHRLFLNPSSSSKSVRITRSILCRYIVRSLVFVPRTCARVGTYTSLSYTQLSLSTKRAERFECLCLSCRRREWFYTSSLCAGRPKVSRKRAFASYRTHRSHLRPFLL